MPNSLSAPQSQGHFKFIDGYVSLETWEAPQRARLEAAMTLRAGEMPSRQMQDDRALLLHEYTHFLDATTTAWGLDLSWRKRLLAASLRGEREMMEEESARVFMLDLAEIAVHQAYMVGPFIRRLGDTLSLVHELVDDPTYGVLAVFHFQRGDEIVHSVPLSMLSLLEAHAYANEALLRVTDARNALDADAAAVECILVGRALINSLESPELAEYTVLIRLFRLYFPELSVEEQLEAVVALARFCLDIDTMGMALIAGHIVFENVALGNALAMDLRRGAGRAILFLKTVIGLHEAIASGEPPGLLAALRRDPRNALVIYWQARTGMTCPLLDEFDAMFDQLPNDTGLLDEQVFAESARHNRALLARTSAGRIAFSEFVLPDCLLGDNSPVQPPNRMNLDVEAALDREIAMLGRMQALCADDRISKFYMGPDEALEFLRGLREAMGPLPS